ncbi:MAG: helix-turn-helix domain-containing protein [Acidobacteriota bacterium]
MAIDTVGLRARLAKKTNQKWTQERLAKELGVTLRTVQRWEAGQDPSPLAEFQIDNLKKKYRIP